MNDDEFHQFEVFGFYRLNFEKKQQAKHTIEKSRQ